MISPTFLARIRLATAESFSTQLKSDGLGKRRYAQVFSQTLFHMNSVGCCWLCYIEHESIVSPTYDQLTNYNGINFHHRLSLAALNTNGRGMSNQ
jgi:hypothetical protein